MLKSIIILLLLSFSLIAGDVKLKTKSEFNEKFKEFVSNSNSKIAIKLREHPKLVESIDIDALYGHYLKVKGADDVNSTKTEPVKKEVKKKKAHKDKKDDFTVTNALGLMILIGAMDIFGCFED